MERRLELIVEDRVEHYQDIATYVKHKLRIHDRKIEEELLRKAAGVFMWVVLVIEMLNQAFNNGKVRAMQKKLREVPSDLDEVFWTILEKDNPDKHATTLMLQWVLFAKRLLTPEELYFAVLSGTETEELGAWDQSRDTSETIRRFITSISRGLIEVHEGGWGSPGSPETVQFIHETVNDFLLRNKRLQTLEPALKLNAIGISHDRLRACCMFYIMMKELKPLVKDRSHIKNLDSKYPFLGYASTYVLDHAQEAQVECVTQQALVQWLQQPHGDFERLRSCHDAFQDGSLAFCIGGELLYALSFHDYHELVLFVLESGADVNARGGYYGNALQVASYRGHGQIVVQLLEKGADVNAQGGWYGSALQAASYEGHDQIVQLLLKNGADVNAQGGTFNNALYAASYSGHNKIVQRLLRNRADVNAPGGFHGNALQAASYRGHDQIVQLLLEKGADVNAQGGYHGNAMQAASYGGHRQIVQRLLEKGALQSPQSTTPNWPPRQR